MREGRPTRAAEEGEQEIYAGHERAEGGVMSDFSPDAIAHCSVHGRFSINDSPGGCPDCPEPEEDFLLTDEELEACEERAIKVVALEILEA
jgi:hypothetical protein